MRDCQDQSVSNAASNSKKNAVCLYIFFLYKEENSFDRDQNQASLFPVGGEFHD